MLRRFIAVFLAFSVSAILSVHAQSNWQKGYLVTNAHDTLSGFIDQKEWVANPVEFSFKKIKDDKATEKFSVADVLYFEIEGAVFYQRYLVSISQDEVGANATEKFKDKSVVDTVFLRILQQGKRVTLLNYKDEIKNRFYIKNGNENPIELVYQSYFQSYYQAYPKQGQLYTKEQYKTQLKFIAETSGTFSNKLGWLIKRATYGNRSLLDITSAINGIDGKEMRRKQKELKTKPSINFFVGAGLNVGMLSYQENSNRTPPWIRDKNNSRFISNNPYMVVGFNVIANSNVSKSIFRTDLSYNSLKFYTISTSTGISSKEQIEHTFSQSTFSLTPQFIYNFYNKENFNFFAGAGIRINYSSYQNDLYTITSFYPSNNTTSLSEFFLLKKIWFSGVVEMGVTISKKFEIYLSYIPALEDINDRTIVWYESINSIRLGVAYNFVKK